MRISDWSSDVCSSDLGNWRRYQGSAGRNDRASSADRSFRPARSTAGPHVSAQYRRKYGFPQYAEPLTIGVEENFQDRSRAICGGPAVRPEEHTSELQSLMRISYAVFCLKKKQHTYTHINKKHNTTQ